MNLRALTSLSICLFFAFCNRDKFVLTHEQLLSGSKIEYLSISELSGGKFSPEVQRVCLLTSSKTSRQLNSVKFREKNNGFYWVYCTLDLSFVEVDSLKNLPIEEKVRRMAETNSFPSKPLEYDILPIHFQKGKWYHIFGFENAPISYFVYVEDDMSIRVERFDGGPF